MKIRCGFVSNSSSCSFVLIGFRFDKNKVNSRDIYKSYFPNKEFDEDIFFDDFYDIGLYYSDDIETGAPKNEIILGKIINETDETGLFGDNCFVQYNDIEQMITQTSNIFKNNNVEYKDCGIFIGNRMC